jgi:hypothetical protein
MCRFRKSHQKKLQTQSQKVMNKNDLVLPGKIHAIAQLALCRLRKGPCRILTLAILCSVLFAHTAKAQVTYALTNVWFVTNGIAHIASGDVNRGLAYELNSNQVFVVNKGITGSGTTPAIDVFDGASGASLGSMSMSGVSGGTFLLDQVAAGGDGAIFSANLNTALSAASPYKLYRWQNWLDSTPVVAFSGDPHTNGTGFSAANRIGDTIAITGSGVNTKILAGLGSQLTTNMVLFTTSDGTNFSPHLLAISGFSVGGTGVAYGFAFYTNNTFLVRNNGGTSVALVQFPANIAGLGIGPVSATTISNPSFTIANSTALIDYKPQSGFLAAVSPVNAAPSTVPVVLYTDPVVGNGSCPIQLAVTNYSHPVANGNFAGAVALGGNGYSQYIFSLDCNNGVRCSGITTIPAQAPSISTQPAGGTVYPPFTLNVSASGFCPLIYQWQATNNAGAFTNIPGANSSSYTIASPSTNYYRVVVTNTINLTTSSVAQVTALTPVTNSSVTQLWRVAANQSGYSYLTTSDNTRGIAYDTNTHRVVVASTTGLFVLNGDNGANVGIMNLTGVTFGGLLGGCDQVAIADDGAVYACNLVNGAGFNLFRWYPTNTSIASTAFTGDPGSGSGDRWGDTMTVRGAGVNTQILLASKGTNVALLTTTDGTNYTASLIAITNATSGFAGNGIAFSAGNTFWAKSSGGSLWQIAYDPIGLTGGVLFNYTQPDQIPSRMVGVGVDMALNIVAGINLSDNPDDLQLFQLTGTADAPVLFQQSFFASNNGNDNDNAAISMKNGRIYGLDVNNGILALSYGAPVGTPPFIVTPPASQTVYTNIPVLTFSVNVSGSLPLLYQWRYNSNNISGATSRSYSITNPPLSAAGYYDVIVRNVSGVVTSTPPALLIVITPITSTVVTQRWTLAAGSRSYLDGSSYATRGLAYDTNTGTLLLADHANIYLLAGTNGSDIGTLNTAGLPNQGVNGWLVDQIGVADDGVLYSCNLSLTGPEFSIVQWTSISPGSVGTGYAFGGGTGADPSGTGDRWGDTMAVRGAGMSTEIICGSYGGTYVVVFDTADGLTFTPHAINVTNAPAGFTGTGITFGQSNTFWSVGGANYDLRQVAYDTGSGTGTVIQDYVTTPGTGQALPWHLGGVAVDAGKNILGTIVTRLSDNPSDVRLYLLSGNANPPSLFDQVFFSTSNLNDQENAVVRMNGGLGFGLNVNNGVVAFSYGTPPAPACLITSVSYQAGTGTTLTWTTFNGRTYQVQYRDSLSSGNWTNVGPATVASGATLTYTDSTATGAERYYRIVAN